MYNMWFAPKKKIYKPTKKMYRWMYEIFKKKILSNSSMKSDVRSFISFSVNYRVDQQCCPGGNRPENPWICWLNHW